MRRTALLTLMMLALALGVGLGAASYTRAAVDAAMDLGSRAVLAMESGQPDEAADLLHALARLWREKSPVLERFTSHDALHEVASGILEAQICLDCGDHDDFLRTMAVMNGGLEHLRDTEALSWENLY